jgi:hypothetical protein
MKYLLLIFALLFLPSCNETTKANSPVLKKTTAEQLKKKLSWKDFHKFCGPQNANRSKNFPLLKDAQILWAGTFFDMPDDAAHTVVRIKMNPSDGLADVTLRIPKGMKAKGKELKLKDNVKFKGKMSYLGSRLMDHIVTCDDFKKYEPKPPKPKSR